MDTAQLAELASDMGHMKSLVDAKIAERERIVADMAVARETVREPARGAELER